VKAGPALGGGDVIVNGPVEAHLWKCGSLPLMHLNYSLGSLKTYSKDVIYHMLVKTLKFSATKNTMCT